MEIWSVYKKNKFALIIKISTFCLTILLVALSFVPIIVVTSTKSVDGELYTNKAFSSLFSLYIYSLNNGTIGVFIFVSGILFYLSILSAIILLFFQLSILSDIFVGVASLSIIPSCLYFFTIPFSLPCSLILLAIATINFIFDCRTSVRYNQSDKKTR